jgi:hypothetical protein
MSRKHGNLGIKGIFVRVFMLTVHLVVLTLVPRDGAMMMMLENLIAFVDEVK